MSPTDSDSREALAAADAKYDNRLMSAAIAVPYLMAVIFWAMISFLPARGIPKWFLWIWSIMGCIAFIDILFGTVGGVSFAIERKNP